MYQIDFHASKNPEFLLFLFFLYYNLIYAHTI